MRPLAAILVIAGLATASTIARSTLTDLQKGVLDAEREAEDLRAANGFLARQLAALEELDVLRERLAELESVLTAGDTRVDGRIELAEARVAALREELRLRENAFEEAAQAQRDAVDALVATRVDAVDRVLAERLAGELAVLESQLDNEFVDLRSQILEARATAEDGRATVDALVRSLPAGRDVDELWRELVAPVVQIHGPYSVGSGVLLESQQRSDGARTHVLTAWHVVRDVQDDPSDPVTPVPIRIYLEDSAPREETARVLAHDADRDVCLLVLNSRDPVPNGARLASRERVAGLAMFEPVYAVGCPLGTEPLPTYGAVATPSHVVDGVRYMMINAPTYIGNSGGGIFDGVSHELIGVFAKIYNHGTLRPTIVPHMGLVVPLDEIYDWLDDVGYGVVEVEGARHIAQQSDAARARSVAAANASTTPDTSDEALGQWGAIRR